ncbi:MAG: hypothetical protein RMZ43_004195 [Nostoc sp. CmiVER01]|uniref:hypothetical protein n=1 Tax=Nostoc sp. CmiVER01 TaxID=3075384 RepID=UPI002AD4DD7D|nr:hypothetical protein [Nostoc sp. CmiVER01]MDZ8124513.1 hypothetical protein [Nostoc sp. CmiVER01]
MLYHVRLISYNSRIYAKNRKTSFPLLPCDFNDKSFTEHDINLISIDPTSDAIASDTLEAKAGEKHS